MSVSKTPPSPTRINALRKAFVNQLKESVKSPPRILVAWTLILLITLPVAIRAATSGNFTYELINNGTEVEITAYSIHATGPVDIPAQFESKPVTRIGDFAFSFCSGLTSVTIPVSVTSIGRSAFSSCAGLTSVTLPDNGVTSIEDNAFLNCRGLTSVTLPNSVTSIGDAVFVGCNNLTHLDVGPSNTYFSSVDGVLFNASQTTLYTYPAKGRTGTYLLPDSVTRIGNYAFYNCTGLTNILLPDSITTIGEGVFAGCDNLTRLDVDPANAYFISVDGVLFNASQTTLYTYPAGANEGTYTLPDGVTSIRDYAFYNCSKLWTLSMGNSVTSIGNYAFYNCSGLWNPSIGNSVTTIGDYAFYQCSGLTSATIPDSVTTIGISAFAYCGMWNIPIGNSVTTIGFGAFSFCYRLTSITLPDSVTTIGNNAFYDCAQLKSISIGNNVTTIGDRAFYECASLTSITLPDSVTSIGNYAFYNCSQLTSVSIGNSLTTIGDYTFNGCDNLARVDVDPANSDFSSVDGVLFNASQTTLYTYPGASEGAYSVPYGVTTITDYAFYNCNMLTSVTLPDSVTTIGDHVFVGCDNLKRFDVDPANAFFSSVDGVLFNASRTTLYAYPAGASEETYILPESVITIGDDAFYECSELTRVSIGNSVTTIGISAFYTCSGLTSVSIGNSVTTIGSFAFYNCSKLLNATFAGNAPSSFKNYTFEHAASDFSIYYLDTATGFTSPTWQTYPAEAIDTGTYPDAPWLISHAIQYDTEMTSDLNGEGITLLAAYALDLDPHKPLTGDLPKAVVAGGNLEMDFYAGRSDVTYRVETCTDLALNDWKEDGVSLSPPDDENHRTASVQLDAPSRFMRVKIER